MQLAHPQEASSQACRPELRLDARECGRVSGEPALRRARGRAGSARKVVRPWAQPRLKVSFARAAARHAVPHQQWIPPIGRPAAPRWLRQRATASGVDQGWWGVGASLHRALADRGVGRARARAQRETSNSRFRGQEMGRWRSLSEVAISLNCGLNSAGKFQTGVSNSGAQIPKPARQNSEVPEISCFS